MDWSDVEATADRDPLVYQVLTMIERGLFTQEEGAAALVLAYQSAYNQLREQLLHEINTRMKPLVICPGHLEGA